MSEEPIGIPHPSDSHLTEATGELGGKEPGPQVDPVHRVFVSSTAEDLKRTGHRDAARDAVIGARLFPAMQEYWVARDNPPLDECMAKVSQADVLVVVVAYRFGWVPDGQEVADPKERKSITWLECERAKAEGKDVLAFLVDPDYAWDESLKEEYGLVEAVRDGGLTTKFSKDIKWRLQRLGEFRTWLNERRIRATFTTPDDLRGKMGVALAEWRQSRRPVGQRPATPSAPVRTLPEARRYLQMLRDLTRWMDLHGLKVGSGEATRLEIKDLYVPLRTMALGDDSARAKGSKADDAAIGARQDRSIDLREALNEQRCLVVVGDPGAGKTTFLKRVAFELCCGMLGESPRIDGESLDALFGALPVCIRIVELAKHIDAARKKDAAAMAEDAPRWLSHFAEAQSRDAGIELDESFFLDQFKRGSAVILLDGLDEAPSLRQRASLARLVEKAAAAWACHMVVTTRPPAYAGEVVLKGFPNASIAPLGQESIQFFLKRWCDALWPDSPTEADKHFGQLLDDVQGRRQIRRMASNPVMLTALAVVHWKDKRLPEQRAELYESIISWLAKRRESRPERPNPKRCVGLLQNLALAMQDHPKGRQVQVPRHWGAEKIASGFRDVEEPQRLACAESFLAAEELDSGIIVGRGDYDVAFWHLTFQEYLAARALDARSEKERAETLLRTPKLHAPEWREVVLLLAGVLCRRGIEPVDAMFNAILDRVGPELPDKARCAGLLHGVLRDLSPIGYRPEDPRYEKVLRESLAVFDATESADIDIKLALEAAEAIGQAGDPRFADDALESNWVTIPAGEFLMGAQKASDPNYDGEAFHHESPVHRVRLNEFRIGRYPVTVGQYARFMEADGYKDEGLWAEEGFGKWGQPDGWDEQREHATRPVVGVSWFEARAYAAWADCRLPTEAEWERAARGTEGRRYPWGNERIDPSRADYGAYVASPTPVGVYPNGATPEGICDLAGNVWEWCRDQWHGNYREAPGDGSAWEEADSSGGRVLRGGSWLADPWYCRSACRGVYAADGRYDDLGFRVVVSFGGVD